MSRGAHINSWARKIRRMKWDTDKCIEFKGTIGSTGYGQITLDYKRVSAHRYSYLVHVGKLSEDLYVLHKCNNKSCINPRHLYAGTQADNMADYSRSKSIVRVLSHTFVTNHQGAQS